MKMRFGFVSNSSSSSFVLLGFHLGNFRDRTIMEKVERLMGEGKDIVVTGKSLYDGMDVFLLCQEVWELMKVNRERLNGDDFNDFSFYENVMYSDGGGSVSIKELKEKIRNRQGYLTCEGGDVDQHSSCDEESFRTNYLDDGNGEN